MFWLSSRCWTSWASRQEHHKLTTSTLPMPRAAGRTSRTHPGLPVSRGTHTTQGECSGEGGKQSLVGRVGTVGNLVRCHTYTTYISYHAVPYHIRHIRHAKFCSSSSRLGLQIWPCGDQDTGLWILKREILGAKTVYVGTDGHEGMLGDGRLQDGRRIEANASTG